MSAANGRRYITSYDVRQIVAIAVVICCCCFWWCVYGIFFFWFSRILILSHSLSNRFTYLTNSTSRYQLLDSIIRLVLFLNRRLSHYYLYSYFRWLAELFTWMYSHPFSTHAVALSSFPWEIIKKILSIHFWAQHSHATGCYANNASLSLHHITLLLSVLVVVSTFFFIFILISQLLWNA